MAGLPTITGVAFVPSIKDDMVRFPQNGGDPFGSARGKFSQRWFDKESQDWKEARESWVDLSMKGALLQRFVNEHQPNSSITFSGEFHVREYEVNGEKRLAPTIEVKSFEFERKGQRGNGQQSQGAQNVASQLGGQPDPWGASPAQSQGGWGQTPAASSPPF